MSVLSPFRQASLRIPEPWICSTCARSVARSARPRNPHFASPRRCLNTTKQAKQSHMPSMDDMHARYKEKNRTTMWESELGRLPTRADNLQELRLQHHPRHCSPVIWLGAHVQDGTTRTQALIVHGTDISSRRSVKPPDGAASPSSPLPTATPPSIPPNASNPSTRILVSE